MEEKIVVELKDISKEYKIYNRKKDKLIETLFPIKSKHSIFKALDDVNLVIKEGEALGILGKNGAGKSTLLKIITGVVSSTSGSICVNGKVSSLLELGTAFNNELTGLENIYEHCQIMGFSKEKINEIKDDIIEFADIGDYLYQPVKTYSSGMFARLAFACAINVNPDILIIDEILSVGDISFQLKCLKKIEDFKKKNKTIIIVTHNLGDILESCTRAIIIDKGRKIFDGDTKKAVDTYKKLIIKNSELVEKSVKSLTSDNWKTNFNINQNMITYGNKKAEIIDYGIFDEQDNYLTSIDNKKTIRIKMKIKFNEPVFEPIFALSIKDFKGMEICGTNTKEVRCKTGNYNKDDEIVVTFEQLIPLSTGKYTLSFGCTKYNENGELEVYDRKYDAIIVETKSLINRLGFFDLDTNVKIDKI